MAAMLRGDYDRVRVDAAGGDAFLIQGLSAVSMSSSYDQGSLEAGAAAMPPPPLDPSASRVDVDVCGLFDQGRIQELAQLLAAGTRLSGGQAQYLQAHPDLVALGELARQVMRQRLGSQVYYNINRHVNPTNICVYSCRFCSYAKKPRDQDAYAYSIAEIVDKVQQAVRGGADEIHMVGGLHPRWNLEHFLKIIRAIKQAAPQIHLKGFTAVELWWLARRGQLSIKATLLALKRAGLDSLPGGGAEIFDDEVRQQITAKMDAATWLQTHETAHQMGLKSNATMLYGHVESPHHRLDHMFRLRELQDRTQGFNAFIPLAFQPHDNTMGIKDYTLGEDDLRTLAMARLVLDNFKYIKAYWIMLGHDIAQLAPYFGANDLDGTVVEEKIAKAAGGRSGNYLSEAKLHRMITATGHVPTRRDSIYRQFWPQTGAATAAAPAQEASQSIARTGGGLLERLRQAATPAAARQAQATLRSALIAPEAGSALAQWLVAPAQWSLLLRTAQRLQQIFDHSAGIAPTRRLLVYTPWAELVASAALPPPALVMLDLSLVADAAVLAEQLTWIRQQHPSAYIGLMAAERLMSWYGELSLAQLAEQLGPQVRVLHMRQDSTAAERRSLAQLAATLPAMSTYVPLVMTPQHLQQPAALAGELMELAEMTPEHEHVYVSVQVPAVARLGTWMISEYLQLLSFIRLISPMRHLSCPFEGCPVMSSPAPAGTKTQHPQEKILGLIASTSCDDFGSIPAAKVDGRLLRKIFAAAGGYEWQFALNA